MKEIFANPHEGERKAKLVYKWESIPKHINRLKLPKSLKQAFFKKGHGSTLYFGGLRVRLSSTAKDVLKELRERHHKMYGDSEPMGKKDE